MRIILWVAGIWITAGPGNTWAHPAWQDTVAADGRDMANVTTRLVTAPLRASSRDWLVVGTIGLGVLAASSFDKDMRRDAARLDHGWEGTVDDVGHTFQRVEVLLGTSVLCYGGGLATHRPALRRTGEELIVAFAVASAGTQLVKHLAGRARPYTGSGSDYFVGPTLNDSYLSLWSGDVTTAFALASVLSAEAKHPVVTVLMYGLASTTAFQRIHTDRHWFSDVVSAAVWSTAVGIGTVKIGNRKTKIEKQNQDRLSFRLMPMGVAVEW